MQASGESELDQTIARAADSYGRSLCTQGRYPEASQQHRRAHEIFTRLADEGCTDREAEGARAAGGVARSLAACGKIEEAEVWAMRAYEDLATFVLQGRNDLVAAYGQAALRVIDLRLEREEDSIPAAGLAGRILPDLARLVSCRDSSPDSGVESLWAFLDRCREEGFQPETAEKYRRHFRG